ncbi:MAG: 6-carboxytetrahydropterin synthase [Gammaproteobacteria bacterium]|nr:6-carboxytetrahydropterin synthase [Gammaproteobacteria bacterium]
MSEITTIELYKENFEFAAGHFTIFSPTTRERLHGHNFRVAAKIDSEIVPDRGMAFDYGVYKEILHRLCKQLDSYFLLPTMSPYLRIETEGDYYYAYFHEDKIPFLKKDVLLLPLRNISVEELAKWFLEQIVADEKTINQHRVVGVYLQVFSGPGQGASASWKL